MPLETPLSRQIRSATPVQVARQLGLRVRHLRLQRGWARGELGERAGLSPETIGRFERTGRIGVLGLLKLVFALGALDAFEGLLAPEPQTLEEFELGRPTRQRGRRRRSGPA